MANMYIPIWKVHICQITSHWEWLGLSQFIAHLRLLGVLEVDAGLSEPPGQAKSEQIGVVPRFVIWYDPNIILSNLWGSYHKELPSSSSKMVTEQAKDFKYIAKSISVTRLHCRAIHPSLDWNSAGQNLTRMLPKVVIHDVAPFNHRGFFHPYYHAVTLYCWLFRRNTLHL